MVRQVFIVGVGRSGTTLLQSILNSHSKISFPPETHFVKKYLVPEIKNNKRDFTKLIDELSNDHSLDNVCSVNIQELKVNESLPIAISAQCYDQLFSKPGISYIGDKDPMNLNFLKYIHLGFPHSKVIHIVREPKDVIASRLNSDWSYLNSVLWHSSEYKYSLNKGRTDGPRYFGPNYLEIKYEDLIESTQSSLESICKFLDISFEENMLNHHENASEVIKDHELSWKKNVLNPINSSSIGKWKETLSQKQATCIEGILSREMTNLSYEKHYQSPRKTNFSNLGSSILVKMFKIRFG